MLYIILIFDQSYFVWSFLVQSRSKCKIISKQADKRNDILIETNYNLHIGIRPEHLEITDKNDENTFNGTVIYKENLGSDIFFHVNIENGTNKIIVRGLPQFTHQITNGSNVSIKRVSNKALLFNEAGMRVQFNNA